MGMIITLQLGGTLHIAPHESVIFLKTLLVFHLLHLGNPLLNDQTPRRSSCGCGFQQLTALLCKACDCSIDFFSPEWPSFIGPTVGFLLILV